MKCSWHGDLTAVCHAELFEHLNTLPVSCMHWCFKLKVGGGSLWRQGLYTLRFENILGSLYKLLFIQTSSVLSGWIGIGSLQTACQRKFIVYFSWSHENFSSDTRSSYMGLNNVLPVMPTVGRVIKCVIFV